MELKTWLDQERGRYAALAEFLGIRDSTVSQHLAVLRRDKVIAARRDGQTIWYRIESQPARDIVQTLYQNFCKAVDCVTTD